MLNRLAITSIIVTLCAVLFWAAAILGVCSNWPTTDETLVQTATVTESIAAVLLWLTWWKTTHDRAWQATQDEFSQDRSVLIRTLGALVPARPLAKTIPMKFRVP